MLESKYKNACEEVSDINEHIPTLKKEYLDRIKYIYQPCLSNPLYVKMITSRGGKIVR